MWLKISKLKHGEKKNWEKKPSISDLRKCQKVLYMYEWSQQNRRGVGKIFGETSAVCNMWEKYKPTYLKISLNCKHKKFEENYITVKSLKNSHQPEWVKYARYTKTKIRKMTDFLLEIICQKIMKHFKISK